MANQLVHREGKNYANILIQYETKVHFSLAFSGLIVLFINFS